MFQFLPCLKKETTATEASPAKHSSKSEAKTRLCDTTTDTRYACRRQATNTTLDEVCNKQILTLPWEKTKRKKVTNVRHPPLGRQPAGMPRISEVIGPATSSGTNYGTVDMMTEYLDTACSSARALDVVSLASPTSTGRVLQSGIRRIPETQLDLSYWFPCGCIIGIDGFGHFAPTV